MKKKSLVPLIFFLFLCHDMVERSYLQWNTGEAASYKIYSRVYSGSKNSLATIVMTRRRFLFVFCFFTTWALLAIFLARNLWGRDSIASFFSGLWLSAFNRDSAQIFLSERIGNKLSRERNLGNISDWKKKENITPV